MTVNKVINGKVVSIDNFELFIKAAEGEAIYKSEVLKNSSDIIKDKEVIRIIEVYEAMVKILPFPLDCIEDNIKYAIVANLMQKYLKEENDMWVSEALFVTLSDHRVLRIKRNIYNVLDTWVRDGEDIDIWNYTDSIGYQEYTWVLNQVLNRKNTHSFYVKFMRELVMAVDFNLDRLREELVDILNIQTYNKINFKTNSIIDVGNGNEYILDIYYKGKRKIPEKALVISMVSDDVKEKDQYTKVYGYEVYVKERDSEGNIKPMSKTSLIGVHNLFSKAIGIQQGLEEDTTRDFVGLIIGRDLVYNIDGVLCVNKAFRISDTIEIDNNCELIGYKHTSIYYRTTEHIVDDVIKETVYEYNIRDNNKHICCVKYHV